MTPRRKYVISSVVSGVTWGCLVAWIAFDANPNAVWGGLIASPIIGLAVGWATRRWYRLPTSLRIATTLVSLYAAATLFGLAVGLYDWLAVNIPNRIPYAVVLQSILAVLWGLTFLGWVFLLWPLSYLNHWLLGRLSSESQLTTP